MSGSPTRGVCTDGGGVVSISMSADTHVQCLLWGIFVDRTLTREASCRGPSGTHRSLTFVFFLGSKPILPRVWRWVVAGSGDVD